MHQQGASFSALQRAENSSIEVFTVRVYKQIAVSVLFSEPKIPQFVTGSATVPISIGFSALQRAENSSIPIPATRAQARLRGFSALQRAENSSISAQSGR